MTKKPNINAVELQRKIRKKICSDTEQMNFEELKEYIQSRVEKNKNKPVSEKSD